MLQCGKRCPFFRQMNSPLPLPPRVKPLQIGPVTVECPVVLAPMTGVTDMPFRRLVRRYGSGLNVTEMIASPAMIRETRQSLQKAAWDPVEEPVSLQLAGCSPSEMAEAAKLAELLGDAGAEALALAGSNDQRAYGHGARLARRQPLL